MVLRKAESMRRMAYEGVGGERNGRREHSVQAMARGPNINDYLVIANLVCERTW